MSAAQREDAVVLYRRVAEPQYFLLLALPKRSDVLLIRFESLSGALQFTGKPRLDVFSNKDEAVRHLILGGEIQVEGRGEAVLGYIVIGSTGLLLLVERARVSASLPGDINIKTVTSAHWYRIPCQADVTQAVQSESTVSAETLESHINKITDFPVQGAHWYCEDADVTRPFPSHHSASDPSWQFTWNAWLSESFRSVKLDDCCPALMEGTAESRELIDGLGDPFNLVLLSRRTRLNPGTRYIARGLNDLSEPGNEIECEQIVWRPEKEPNGNAFWNRYSWRRGTVPIRWGVFLKNSGLGEAEIVIRKQKTFAGCKRYIRRLQKRFAPLPEIEQKLNECKEEKRTSEKLPIVFVSLLRKGLPDKNRSETNLAAAFDKALSSMRKMHKLNVAYYALDWHEMDKQLGTQGLIEALWTTMRGMLQAHSLASGHYTTEPSSIPLPRPSETESCAVLGEDVPKTDWCGKQTMRWHTQQQGLARYNCADSLDRTNIASFFISVQVFVEQCRRLELAVLTGDDKVAEAAPTKRSLKDRLLQGLLTVSGVNQSPSNSMRPSWPSPTGRSHRRPNVQFRQDLPVGWEARIDEETGHTYYIDHVNKNTSWTPPPEKPDSSDESGRNSLESKKSFRVVCKEEILSKQAWAMLEASVDEIRRKVLPEALSSIADVFLQNGDRNAFFYTGSQAMHSDKIMIFEPETSQLKKNSVSGASNSFIAITRRYNNILRDNDRQAQIELFLGINLEKYFLSSRSTGLDLGSLNILYQPRNLTQDTLDTDDEDDPVNHIDYPSFGRTIVVNPEPQLEPRRSVSSPNLARYEYDEATQDMKKVATTTTTEDEQIQMYSFEDEIPSMQKKPESEPGAADEGTSAAELVPGLREISTSRDPLR